MEERISTHSKLEGLTLTLRTCVTAQEDLRNLFTNSQESSKLKDMYSETIPCTRCLSGPLDSELQVIAVAGKGNGLVSGLARRRL